MPKLNPMKKSINEPYYETKTTKGWIHVTDKGKVHDIELKKTNQMWDKIYETKPIRCEITWRVKI